MNRSREVKRDFQERVSHKWAIWTKWYQAINPREGVYLSFQNLGDKRNDSIFVLTINLIETLTLLVKVTCTALE